MASLLMTPTMGACSSRWAGDRHWTSEEAKASSKSRDMLWPRGALAASSLRLNEENKLSYSLSAMKLVTVGEQVHARSPD